MSRRPSPGNLCTRLNLQMRTFPSGTPRFLSFITKNILKIYYFCFFCDFRMNYDIMVFGKTYTEARKEIL